MSALEAERNDIDEQLAALDEATQWDDETPEQAARRHELNVRWLELTDQIEAGHTEAAVDAARKEALAPDAPRTFDELHASTAELREQVLNLRVGVEERREAIEALPVGSARREKAEHDLAAAQEAMRTAIEAADRFHSEHDLRLSTEKIIDDVTTKAARERWAQAHDASIAELRRRNDEALRRGEWGYETEIRKLEARKLQPPTDEYIEAVRGEMIAAKAAEAAGFDWEFNREKADAAIAATKTTNNPYALAAGRRSRSTQSKRPNAAPSAATPSPSTPST
jgi:hypothetical protein